MTSKGCRLLCQITSPLGGWWGREPSLGRVRLTLWSAGAGGAARDMWRNWSWCSFVCCLLPPSGHAASGQLPEAQDHGSTFFRVQPPCSPPPSKGGGGGQPAGEKVQLTRTVGLQCTHQAPLGPSWPYFSSTKRPQIGLGLQFGKKDGRLVKLPAGEWALRNAPAA